MPSDNIKFTKLSTEEEETNIPSFLVPSASAIPPSPLLIPSHSLPLEVSKSILDTLSKDEQSTQEHVIYCEPPRKLNGFTSPRFLFLLSLVIGVTVGLCTFRLFNMPERGPNYYFYEYGTEDEINYHLHSWWSLFGIIPSLYLAVFLARFEFFGYRVVTNHRAALVIPKRHMIFFPSTSRSANFKTSMDKMMAGELKESCCSFSSKMASLFYQNDKMSGQAVIYGEKKPLDFFVVSDLKTLDDALSGAVHATATYSGIKMGTSLHLRTESSFPSPAHEQLMFRCEFTLLFMLPFFLFSGLITLFVLKTVGVFYCYQLMAAVTYALFLLPTTTSVGIKIRKQRLSIDSQRAIIIGSAPSATWA